MRARHAAAAAIVAGLAVVGFATAPPYLANWRLSRALDEVAAREDAPLLPDDVLRAAASEKAAAMGIAAPPDQVTVTRRGQGVRIEARYQVRVDLGIYTVDLHLRARGGP
jgi:hypothetical protein